MAQDVDPAESAKELMRLTVEYAKAYREVNDDLKDQQDLIKSYLGVTDGYTVQEADAIPEPEVPSGPSPLFIAISKLAEKSMHDEEPDPFLVGMAALGERKWTDKQKMAMWLFCATKHKETLREMGIDATQIPKPDLAAIVIQPTLPIKEIWNDDRSMGFVVKFRYLPKDEFRQVRTGISNVLGRQYHDGSRVDSRLDEPHWVIPGDSQSVESFYRYLVKAFNGKNSRFQTLYTDEPEKTDWHTADDVAERMQNILTRAERMVRMSKAHSTEWKPTYEYLWMREGELKSPMPFQIAGAEYALAATEESRLSKGKYGQGVMIGDPMGLGKTLEALITINEAWERELLRNPNLKREDLRALIMCPASVKINWSREIDGWLERFGYKIQILRGMQIQPIWGNFVISNPQLIRKEYNTETYEYEPAPLYIMLLAQKWFAVVADESHQYKSWKAQRTANALELFSGRRYNIRKLSMEQWRFPIPLRIMISGSPILNRPDEFPTQLEALGMLEQFGGKARFENMYCSTRDTSRLKELNMKLREKGYLRREKEDMVMTPQMKIVPLKNISQNVLNTTWVDRSEWERILNEQKYEFLPGVLGQMPAKIRTVNYVQLSNRKTYQKAVDDFVGWLRDHYAEFDDRDQRVARSAANIALTKITFLKWLCAKGKVQDAIVWINRFMEETGDEKLVLYVDHRDVFQLITDAFPDSARIIGGQDEMKRQENVDLFQKNPEVRLMVAMLTAGGIGITLTAANHMAFLEMGWSPAIHDQAEERIWGRLNDLHGASIYYLLAENTIDQHIAFIIDSKRELVTAGTQGSDVDQTAVITEIANRMLAEASKKRVTLTEDEGENGEG